MSFNQKSGLIPRSLLRENSDRYLVCLQRGSSLKLTICGSLQASNMAKPHVIRRHCLLDEGFQTANEIDRFAIGDRDMLKFNDDGSLDIYLQNENSGVDKVSNWLPAPTTAWNLCMRLYAPKTQALDGNWNPPPVQKVA